MSFHKTSEEYFIHRDQFIAYILDEVNPAREKQGLSQIREVEAGICFRVMIDFLDKWEQKK